MSNQQKAANFNLNKHILSSLSSNTFPQTILRLTSIISIFYDFFKWPLWKIEIQPNCGRFISIPCLVFIQPFFLIV